MLKRLLAAAAALALTAAFFCACGPNGGDGQAAYYRFTDARGREVALAAPPARVVSFMGSYAETWLLAGGSVLGVTSDVVEEQRFALTPEMTVVGTVKAPDLELALSLSPDFVLLSCDIAAHVRAAETLRSAGIAHAFFKVERFSDYLAMLKVATDLTGRADLYEKNGLRVERSILATLESLPAGARPSVLYLRAYSTGIKAKADDNMVTYMLQDFGCENVAEKEPTLANELSIEAVIAADPDVILASSMGDEAKATATFAAFLARPELAGLTAVRKERYAMLPKELFHYKPNARWGGSYEYLKEILFA